MAKTGREVNKVQVGEECNIRVVLENKRRLVKPVFLIGIRNDNGLEIATLTSVNYEGTADFDTLGVIKCTIPNLPLFPGGYHIRFGTIEGSSQETLLYSETVAKFLVTAEAADWFHCQKVVVFLSNSEWTFTRS